MTGQPFDAFVSAVSSEFGQARDSVAAELRRQEMTVSVQGDFEHMTADTTTLDKIHAYIKSCAEVHCAIGSRAGAFPPTAAAEPYAALLPPGITRASYTQWEYFFAMAYARERTWLYIAKDYPPERPPNGVNDTAAQDRFVRYVRDERGQDFAEFSNVGDLLTAVLRNRIEQRRVEGTIGAFGAAVFVWVLLSCLYVGFDQHWSDPVRATGLFVGFVLGGACGWNYYRYAAILPRRGPHARRAYEGLRQSLASGGMAAAIYVRRLTAALNAVDRFFGDARSEGQKPPTWTAPAYDRCLLLALLYPVGVAIGIWAAAGSDPLLDRVAVFAVLVVPIPCGWRAGKARGWRRFAWVVLAAAVSVPVAVAGDVPVGVVFFGAFFAAVAGAVAGSVAGTGTGTRAVAVAVAVAFALAVDVAVAGTGTRVVVGEVAAAVVFTVVLVVSFVGNRAVRNGWHGRFLSAFTIGITLACLAGAATLGWGRGWELSGEALLFLGLLTVVNAPFDWVSLGLTRLLLRFGLRFGGRWAYALAILDAFLAAVFVAGLTVVSILAVQTFDKFAAHGGAERPVLPLHVLLPRIGAGHWNPDNWWIYFMLVSTMIPSLANLAIGGASLLHGIPRVNVWLLRQLSQPGGPAPYQRAAIAACLTAQNLAGAVLGFLAQGVLLYIVIDQLLPQFGFTLLGLAEWIAANNFPGQLLGALFGW